MGGDSNEIQLFSRGGYFLPKLTTLLFVIFEVNRSLRQASAQYMAYCSAYCDVYDNLIPGTQCESFYHPVYCCGTVYNKTCCGDVLYEVEDTLDETMCGNAWLYYQWCLIYGLVAVLMVVLMIIICCVCCRGYQIISRRNRDSGGRQERGEGVEPDSRSLGFDPGCEFAFEPPRYETLPKDPPKYSEVFTEHANPAFLPDEQQSVAPLTTTSSSSSSSSSSTTTTTTTTAAGTEPEPPAYSPSDVTVQTPVLCSDSLTSGDVEVDGRCQAEMVVVTVADNGSEL